MKSILAVVTSIIVYILQTLLIFAVSILVSVVAIKAGGLRQWVPHAYTVITWLVASCAGGYVTMQITKELFPTVNPLVTLSSFVAIFILCCLYTVYLMVFSSQPVFSDLPSGIMFFVNVCVTIFMAIIGYRRIHKTSIEIEADLKTLLSFGSEGE